MLKLADIQCNKTNGPISFDVIEVFAALIKHSCPISSTLNVRWSWIYFTASLHETSNKPFHDGHVHV